MASTPSDQSRPIDGSEPAPESDRIGLSDPSLAVRLLELHHIGIGQHRTVSAPNMFGRRILHTLTRTHRDTVEKLV